MTQRLARLVVHTHRDVGVDEPRRRAETRLCRQQRRDLGAVAEQDEFAVGMPGEGDFDVAAFLAPVLANDYDGPISLEIFNDHYKARPPAPLARQGMTALHEVTSAAMTLATKSVITNP